MSYLNDVYYSDPVNGNLYKMTNDATATGYPVHVGDGPTSILVATNQVDVYVACTNENLVYWYQNGDLQKSIKVGNKPTCMCEDPKGNIYVTNYGSRTVSKISNGMVQKNIYVGNGPKGICSNENGDIYVTLYLENKVVKIANDILLPGGITVGKMPSAIRCDKDNALWVACTFSNMVSKIYRDEKIKDITVGTFPYDIIVDKQGDKWVSNYGSNSVTKIVGDVAGTRIPVGEKPYALTTNENGEVYVYNSGENTIYKINGVTVTAKITACYGPMGIGDPTGFQAYYVHKFKKESHDGSGLTVVKYSDLDADLRSRIDNAGTGGVQLPIDDAQVNHEDLEFNTVKKALDYLLYKEPVITTFSNDINAVEIGSTVNDVTFTFGTNKDKKLEALNIDNGIGSVLGKTSTTASGLNLTKDTTFTLTAKDEKGKVVTKTTSIKFLNSVYFGASNLDVKTSADVLALANNKLASSKNMSATFDCSGGKYIYIAMPITFGLKPTNFKIGGLANSAWDVTTISITNAHKHVASYAVFKSQNLQNGAAIKVDIA